MQNPPVSTCWSTGHVSVLVPEEGIWGWWVVAEAAIYRCLAGRALHKFVDPYFVEVGHDGDVALDQLSASPGGSWWTGRTLGPWRSLGPGRPLSARRSGLGPAQCPFLTRAPLPGIGIDDPERAGLSVTTAMDDTCGIGDAGPPDCRRPQHDKQCNSSAQSAHLPPFEPVAPWPAWSLPPWRRGPVASRPTRGRHSGLSLIWFGIRVGDLAWRAGSASAADPLGAARRRHGAKPVRGCCCPFAARAADS